MAQFTLNPGWGSATRAGPMGIKGEARATAATASVVPAMATTPTSASPRATSWLRSMPSARRVGFSVAATNSCRDTIWPITMRAVTAASREKMTRAAA